MSASVASARQMARVGRGYLADVVRRPAARTAGQIPTAPERVTDEWLTATLCRGTGARVRSHRLEPISRGSTVRSRLVLEYEGADGVDEQTLPPTVFVKATSTFLTRLQVGATGGMSGEVRFYDRIGPSTPILAPTGYHGVCDRRSGRSILLLEDLARTRDVTFGEVRSTLDRAHAEALVRSLAVVHGCLEGSPRFAGDLRWVLSSRRLQEVLNTYVDSEGRSVAGLDLAGDVIPAPLRALRSRLHGYRMRALELDDHCPVGLVHHDVHAGNWFATADGRMGLFDWSAYARGQGPRDVAYALMSSLTIADRRAWERELLALYAAELSEVSGSPHDPAATWTAYRQQTLHGLCFWLATLGSGSLQPKMQPDDVSMVNIERMAQAVVDLDTFTALDH
ncbi:phosphotransferase [Pseudonocardia pini]|uniref:phosphotransferase n=1 Tax=Pseudonocardia pini TaxID=2758030 RepID=UPI0015F00B57|nr:phosphotransferase [Pseudonocardia pini]